MIRTSTVSQLYAIAPKSHQTNAMVSSLVNKGIYYNLPTFRQHDGKKYSAIVTGANGITGSAIVDVLASSPERWGTVFAMSRKPGSRKDSNVENIAADFLKSPESLATLFKEEGVKAYVALLQFDYINR